MCIKDVCKGRGVAALRPSNQTRLSLHATYNMSVCPHGHLLSKNISLNKHVKTLRFVARSVHQVQSVIGDPSCCTNLGISERFGKSRPATFSPPKIRLKA